MTRHLPVVRIRVSTALIALVFLVALVVYLLIRPTPASIAKENDRPATHQPSTGRSTRSPSPSSHPTRSPVPSPTRSPAATATGSTPPSAGPHSSSPSPATAPTPAEPTTPPG